MSGPNLSGIRRRLLVSLAALSLLAMLGVCYYYYFNRKEQELEERNFRILHRIEDNFGRRIQDYQKQLLSQIKTCPPCLDAKGNVLFDSLQDHLNIGENIRLSIDAAPKDVDWEFQQKGRSNVITFHFSNRDIFPKNVEKPYFSISLAAETILKSVLRDDVFPSYHLGEKGAIAYNDCPEVCDLLRSDSLDRNDHIQILNVGSARYYVFSHPFSLTGARGMVLSGIQPAERFNHDKFNVPGNFLLGLFLFLLVILLSFPFIKSFLVSPEETLRVPDVLLALLSLFLLCYMSTFIHLSVFAAGRDDIDKKRMLEQTSDSLSRAFLDELYHMRRQLTEYDRLYADRYDDLGQKKADSVSEKIPAPQIYPDFYRVFWLNRQGIQVKEVDQVNNVFFELPGQSERDYHDREYFKAVSRNELWYPDSAETKKFYLAPVYSRTDGTFRAVLGMKSRDTALMMLMSSELRSVIGPILPREIDFCLLNAKGEIMFTSTGNQHLQEDFREECNFSPAVADALNSRERRFVNLSFMGRDCSICISPLEGLPLYIATITYNEFGGNTQLQVCIYTSLFILSILTVFSLVIFLLVFLTRKNTNPLIRRPYLDISLLFPSSKFLYRDFGGIVFNIVLMVAVVAAAYVSREEPCTLIALLLLNASGTTAAFCFCRLDTGPGRQILFWIVTILTFIFVDILLWNIGAGENLLSFVSLILFECLLLLVVFNLRRLHVFEASKEGKQEANPSSAPSFLRHIVRLQQWFKQLFEEKIGHKLTFYNQYALMLVTWFCLVTIIPTIFVFQYLYRNEFEYRIRSAQIDMSKRVFEHEAFRFNKEPGKQKSQNTQRPQTFFTGYFSTQIQQQILPLPDPQEQKLLFERLLSMYRLSWNKGIESRGTGYFGSHDSSIRFGRSNDSLLLTYHNLLNHPNSQNNNQLQLLSRAPGFPIPPATPGTLLPFFIFILAPLAILVLLFYVINFFLKRFFLFTILPPVRKEDENFFNRIYEKYKSTSLKLIVLGVTASGKRELVRKTVAFIYRQEQKKPDPKSDIADLSTFMERHLHFFDLAEIKESLKELRSIHVQKGDIIVLNHFEHDLAEKETNDHKFDIISSLSRSCEQIQAHLVILSNIHPSVFLNNQKAKKPESGTFNAEDYINTQDYYNWTGLLSGFEIFVKHYPARKPPAESLGWEESFEIYEETKSRYIYYLSIWNSLERVEKFVAYDLATDGLVNYRNKAALYSLYTKGLVVMSDVPELMNDEFRTFILTEISESDVELEKRQSGGRSSWDMFRVPFLAILFGALMFVFLTQQEAFNKIMAGLAAIAGSVPLLIKLFTQEKKPA